VCSLYLLEASLIPKLFLALLLFKTLGSVTEIMIFHENKNTGVICMVKKVFQKLFTDVIEVITNFGISLVAGIALLT
jgi:hypothetical protein